MAFNNKLFVIGDGNTANYPYRSPDVSSIGEVEAELSGYPISAADFNTYLRSTSLVTYALAEAIKKGGLNVFNPNADLEYNTSTANAVTIVAESLKSYVTYATKVDKAKNLIPTDDPTGNQLYYLGDDKTTTKFVEIENGTNESDKKVLIQNGTNAPVLSNENKLSVNDSKYIRIDDSGSTEIDGNYKLNFELDTTNKILTISWKKA